MTGLMCIGSATSMGSTIQNTANVSCIDYVHNVLKESHVIFTDTELTCIPNWFWQNVWGMR